MDRPRVAAAVCMGCLALSVVLGVVTVFRSMPRGLVTVGLLVLALLAAWEGVGGAVPHGSSCWPSRASCWWPPW